MRKIFVLLSETTAVHFKLVREKKFPGTKIVIEFDIKRGVKSEAEIECRLVYGIEKSVR